MNLFKPSSKIFLLIGASFVDHLWFVMPLSVSVYLSIVVTFWERADLLALVCGV